MSLHSILRGVLEVLHAAPSIEVDCAELRPGIPRPEVASVAERAGVRFPPWVVMLYEEIGGAHVSWRLGERYRKARDLSFGEGHRYDISGNFDLLSPQEACRALTDHPWFQLYGEPSSGDLPIELASFDLTARCSISTSEPEQRGPALHISYEDRVVQLDVTPAEYARRGAELLFLPEWQLTLIPGEDHGGLRDRLRRETQQLLGWRDV